MIIDFSSIESIKKSGFSGFVTISALQINNVLIPKQKGVYLVLRSASTDPEYLTIGSGGYFKGKDPNVSLSTLQNNWVKGGQVVYIGKAGSEMGTATCIPA